LTPTVCILVRRPGLHSAHSQQKFPSLIIYSSSLITPLYSYPCLFSIIISSRYRINLFNDSGYLINFIGQLINIFEQMTKLMTTFKTPSDPNALQLYSTELILAFDLIFTASILLNRGHTTLILLFSIYQSSPPEPTVWLNYPVDLLVRCCPIDPPSIFLVSSSWSNSFN
jgi:hypothetical protein